MPEGQQQQDGGQQQQGGQQQGQQNGQQQGTPWYHGKLEGELLGHAQTLGWDKKSADEAAVEAIRAHREARSFIGVPESQLIKLPVDPIKDPDAMRGVFQRLGAPKEAKDYDFSNVKSADGTALSATLDAAIRQAAFDGNLPKDAAVRMAQAVVKHADDASKETSAVATARLTEERAALDKNWGKNKDANLFIAKQAAQKLGIDPEAVSTLEKMDKVGYGKVMEMFRQLGVKMGEDKFVAGQNPAGTDGIMTREQAQDRLNALKGDKDFGARLLKGDVAARREWDGLHVVAFGKAA